MVGISHFSLCVVKTNPFISIETSLFKDNFSVVNIY